jgi:tetratricopeptide (TPR) repeat protein
MLSVVRFPNILCISLILFEISSATSKNTGIKYYASTYSENIQNILGSKSSSPIAQRDKLKSKSNSWFCETCHDTNDYVRTGDKAKKWMLTISLDDSDGFTGNLGDYDEEYSEDDYNRRRRRNFHEDCPSSNSTQIQTIPDAGHYLALSIIPSKAIFSVFWFLLGVVATVIANFVVMQYMSYMKKYIDNFIEKLEEQCLADYRNGLYANVVHVLVRNIPYVINYRGAKHLDTASFQHLLAKAFLQLGNIAAAESLLQSVRAIYDPLGRDFHLANVLEDIGTVHYARNNYEDALDFYIAALDIHVELLAGSSAEIYLSPSQYKNNLSNVSTNGSTISSSKYEQKYRRHLVNKALSEAKALTAKSPRLNNGYKVISPDGSDMTGFESPVSSKSPEKASARSLSDAFELELESDAAVRELENLLSSPQCVEVSPISANEVCDSPENIRTAESYPLSSASDIPTSPDTIRLHHLIGKVLYNQGRYPTAIEYFSTALEMLRATNGSQETIDELINEIESVSQIFKFRASTNKVFSRAE